MINRRNLLVKTAGAAAFVFLNKIPDAAGKQPETRNQPPPVPGTVIFHIPAATGKYVGSPGIAVMPDGRYLAKCDLFGPMSNELVRPTTLVFASEDRGLSWRPLSKISGMYWASIFTHQRHVYLMGTSRCMGQTVISKSADGSSWTKPQDQRSGILVRRPTHTAPVPIAAHEGSLFRAIEFTDGPFPWNRRFRPAMMSAPDDSDLLDSRAWTLSETVAWRDRWLPDPTGRGPQMWLEGNAVTTPRGDVVDILRVDRRRGPELAAVVRIGKDGRRAEFDPERDFVTFPGGAKKFTIRFDPPSRKYWALVNPAFDHEETAPTRVRNTLALASSSDLATWTVERVIVQHPDAKKHAFQYPDWTFDGSDIIAAVRTAFDDPAGGAHNYHDANFLAFHRVQNFRRP